jgi:hypothetical protein
MFFKNVCISLIKCSVGDILEIKTFHFVCKGVCFYGEGICFMSSRTPSFITTLIHILTEGIFS